MQTCRRLFICIWILGILALPLTAGAQTLEHAWSNNFGDPDYDSAYDVVTDAGGNVFMTGIFRGNVNFGGGNLLSAGSYDVYLVKFDAAGNHVWSKRFGDLSAQYVLGLAIDGAGDVYITGNYDGGVNFGGGTLTSAGSSDIYIAKFDTDGIHVWSQRFGDASPQLVRGIAVDGSNNIVIAGYFQGTVDFGGGPAPSVGGYDVYVAKFDAAGGFVWHNTHGDLGYDTARAVAIDALGNIIVTGYFNGGITFGSTVLMSAGLYDIFIVKYSAIGVALWADNYGDANYQYARGVTTDSSNHIYLTGFFWGTVDFGGGPLTYAGDYDIYLAGFDSNGVHLWSKRFGDSDTQYGYRVTTDGSDNVIVSGDFRGAADFGGGLLSSAGSWDVYTAVFDGGGNHVWSRRFGDQNDDNIGNTVVDGHENLVLCGTFTGSIDFGGGPLVSGGDLDMFVARYWTRPEPRIAGVRDIPNDEGGRVLLSWDASVADTPVEHVITHYTVWRALEPTLVSSLFAAGVEVVDNPSAWVDQTADQSLIRMERVGAETYYWNLAGTVNAYYLPGYSYPTPTFYDSTSAGNEIHFFQVIAHTADPHTFYTSAVDSGYSVDNLAPGAPQNLAGQQIEAEAMLLSWDPNPEADIWHYAVYRGMDPDFVPGTGNRIGEPVSPDIYDGDWRWDSGYCYKVSAIDTHGNESLVAYLGPETVTGTGGDPVPAKTFLAQNHPNPFGHSTRISFGLEEAADVSLRVYDVKGRLVKTLVEGNRTARVYDVEWDGLDDRGDRVASGVYFYYLTAGVRVHIQKAVLLR